jgi:hypothetical protein
MKTLLILALAAATLTILPSSYIEDSVVAIDELQDRVTQS